MLRSPDFSVGEVGNVTLEVAMFITLRDASAVHHSRGTFLHPAIASHRHIAAHTIASRHQLPSRSSAKREMFKSHMWTPDFVWQPVFVRARLQPCHLDAKSTRL